MRSLFAVAGLLGVLAVLPGCPSCDGQTRFWRVTDRSSGGIAYAVDTAAAPLGVLTDAEYLDGAGRLVAVSQPEISQITEAEWRTGTGGADWATRYCMRDKVCWSKPRPK
jgi:hypothetical protein